MMYSFFYIYSDYFFSTSRNKVGILIYVLPVTHLAYRTVTRYPHPEESCLYTCDAVRVPSKNMAEPIPTSAGDDCGHVLLLTSV